MARRTIALGLVGSIACSPDVLRPDTSTSRADIDSAVVGIIRNIDNAPQPDAQLRLGGNTQEADLIGMATTLHIPPGTIPAHGILEDYATAHAPVEVKSGWDATVQLYVAPFTAYQAQVANGAAQLSEPGVFTLTTEEDGLWLDEEPANFGLTAQVAVVDRAATLAMPGSLHALRLDAIVEPISLFYALRLQRPTDEDWRFENSGTLTIDIAADDPMRGVDELYWYWYSSEQGYWRRGGQVTIDGDQVSGPVNLFAWWAIGGPDVPEHGCVSGRVEDGSGGGLEWSEILISSANRFGNRRSQSRFHGEFCVHTPLSADVTAQVFGVSQTTGAKHIGSAEFSTDAIPGDCDGICTDIGVIIAEPASR